MVKCEGVTQSFQNIVLACIALTKRLDTHVRDTKRVCSDILVRFTGDVKDIMRNEL